MLSCEHLMNPNHWVSERLDHVFLVSFTLRPQEESKASVCDHRCWNYIFCGATVAEQCWEMWLSALYNLTSILCAVYPSATLHQVEADLYRNCPLSRSQKKEKPHLLSPFPWQQQTLHTRGARGLQLKQELSLRKMDLNSQSLPFVFCFMSFTFISLLCWSFHVTHTHTQTCLSLCLVQTHIPNSWIAG